ITRINREIFSKLLLKLSEKDEAAGNVARTAADNFDKLREDLGSEVLLKLSEKEMCWGAVIIALAENYYKISANLRSELFSKLIEKGIIIRISAEDWNEEMSKTYVVIDQSQICSTIKFYEKNIDGYKGLFLDTLATSQGKTGYGKSLIKLILYYMHDNKFDFLYGYIFDNVDIIKRYKNLGFDIVGTLEDPHYGTLHKVVLSNITGDKKTI
ncbi:MAG: hypothetical protein U9Q68_06205, partial [Euryarchaeota archaeon]|nr:hypothetical protein [Euryarchaeota archaeon]